MFRARSVAAFVLAAFCGFAAPGTAAGQVTTGGIQGTVKDASQAVVPGAQVTATLVETGFTRSATTDGRGEYAIEFLPVGTYRVEAELMGFKRYAQTGVVIEVGRTARIDPVLEAGGATETVEVVGDSPLVETTKVALGRTVTENEITSLPLVDRDIYALLELTAGVDSSRSTNVFGSPGQETLVNGSSNAGAGSVNYNLDGGANASGLRNTGNIAPNPDAVQEFRVATNSYSAEYGRFAGGVIDVITKSGTNRVRGSAFEFFRDDALNANRWSIGASTLRKDPLERNNFGGSLGGPLVRNRTFLFGSYSGLRQTTTVYDNTARVPTELERRGDFSQSARRPNDPLTGARFPGDIIPQGRLDPVAQRILQDYIPLPNLPDGFHEVQAPRPLKRNEFNMKADHNMGLNHRLTGAYFISRGSDLERMRGNLPWVERDFSWNQQNFNLSETWTVNASMVNDARMTYVRNYGGRLNLPETSLGDLGSTFNVQGAESLPQIQVSGSFNLNSAIAGPVAGSDLYQFRDVFSANWGRHGLRVGGEVSYEDITHDTTLNNYGNFTFDGTRSGIGIGDFLLGVPRRFTQDAPIRKTDAGWYMGLFLQDDFRIHQRVTLNLGVRYDLQTPLVDPQDRKLTFVPGRQSAVVPSAFPGMLFPGDDGVPRGIASLDTNNIAPRLGVAWDVFGDGRTAVRGAFGLFYGTIGGNMWNTTADGQPFTTRQQFDNPGTLRDPYSTLPGGSPFPYEYSPQSPRFVTPAQISGPSLDFVMAKTYQMNVAVQRQLTSDLSATVAYVGNRGHNLPFDRDINYPVMTANATAANANLRRPYSPGQLARIIQIQSVLTNQYDGLQITVDKRMGRQLQASGSYVFAKSLEDASLQGDLRGSAQNMNDLAAERARTSNDRRHVVKLSTIWQPTVGGDGVLPVLVNGWTVSAIVNLSSGVPLTITSGRDNNFDGNGTDRPHLAAGQNPALDPDRPREEVLQQWFNTAAFVMTNLGEDGNAPRNLLDAPGFKNVDMGIYRSFGLGGTRSIQVRLEATNALNLVNLEAPTTGLTSATFGQIRTARPMRQMQLGVRYSF